MATIGTSREFNRMVDLDVRRREVLDYVADLRLKPDRVKEMKDELVTMNRDVDELKGDHQGPDGERRAASAATAGAARNRCHDRPRQYSY